MKKNNKTNGFVFPEDFYLDYQDAPQHKNKNLPTSQGYAVQILQRYLNMLGYKLRITGILDTETAEILMKIQKEAGISVDGCFGNDTRKYFSTLFGINFFTMKKPILKHLDFNEAYYQTSGLQPGGETLIW